MNKEELYLYTCNLLNLAEAIQQAGGCVKSVVTKHVGLIETAARNGIIMEFRHKELK